MMGRRGWPSGHRDDMGHTEESDVRNARPLTLQIDRDKKEASRTLFERERERGNFPSCFWMVPENCMLTGYCHRDAENGQ